MRGGEAILVALIAAAVVVELPEFEIDSASSDIRALARDVRDRPEHRHVVQVRWMRGSIAIDPADPSRCRIRLEAPVRYLAVDPPGVREELGQPRIPSEVRAELERMVVGESMLFAANHPTIRFRADRCERIGSGMVSVRGELEIRGVVRSIEVPFLVSIDRERIEVRAVFDVRHDDFGMQPYRDATVAMAQEITILVRIVARRAGEPGASS